MNDDPFVDPLDAALGLEPVPYDPPVITIPDVGDEYAFARENLARIIGKTEHAIDQLSTIARISAHARAYECLGGLVKTYVDANHELLKLKKTSNDGNGGNGPTTVNNTLVMTGEEVLRLIKSQNKSSV